MADFARRHRPRPDELPVAGPDLSLPGGPPADGPPHRRRSGPGLQPGRDAASRARELILDAAELDYCDQAHLIGVFEAATGTTPAQYVQGSAAPDPERLVRLVG